MTTTAEVEYEYAGFLYVVLLVNQRAVSAHPKAGQHRAANKEKHCRAAVSCYNQDHGIR